MGGGGRVPHVTEWYTQGRTICVVKERSRSVKGNRWQFIDELMAGLEIRKGGGGKMALFPAREAVESVQV